MGGNVTGRTWKIAKVPFFAITGLISLALMFEEALVGGESAHVLAYASFAFIAFDTAKQEAA